MSVKNFYKLRWRAISLASTLDKILQEELYEANESID